MVAVNEKMNIRVKMLRILSLLAVNAFIYAGFAMLRALIFYDDGRAAAILMYAAVILFAHAAGALFSASGKAILDRIIGTKFFRFVTFMLNIKDNDRFMSSSALWVLIIVPFAAVVIAYGSSGIGRTVFELLPVAVGYIAAVKQTRLSHARIMSTAGLYTGMVIMVICLELPYLVNRLAYLRPIYFAVSYFLIFAFLIVKNQDDIERHIFSKKHIDKSVLPRNLRRFNAMAAGFVFLLMMLLFNLKKIVMYLLDIAKQIIQLALIFIGWILDKIMPDSSLGGDAMQTSMSSEPAQRPMPFLNLILNTVVYFVILYVSYKLLFMIVARIPKAFSNIFAALKKLFRMNVSYESSVEADYIDTTETILPYVRNSVSKAKKKKVRVKKLSQITDPVEKVRQMYGNILGMLPSYGIKPDIADTTTEILAKTAGVVDMQEDLSAFTEIYDRVRYGEMVPDGETLARAERYYSKCRTRQPDGY